VKALSSTGRAAQDKEMSAAAAGARYPSASKASSSAGQGLFNRKPENYCRWRGGGKFA
jgi:hypothetical protein